MNCPDCGATMKEGFLFSSKDGAFSFGEEVPGTFTNAKKCKGFVEVTSLQAGHRTHVKADICESCRKVVVTY